MVMSDYHFGFPPAQLYTVYILASAILVAIHNLRNEVSPRYRKAMFLCTFATLASASVALLLAPIFFNTDPEISCTFTFLVYIINVSLILCFFLVLNGYYHRESEPFDGILDAFPSTPPQPPPATDSHSFEMFLDQAPTNENNNIES